MTEDVRGEGAKRIPSDGSPPGESPGDPQGPSVASSSSEEPATEELSKEERRRRAQQEAGEALRDVLPWSSPMTRLDKVLVWCIFGSTALLLASLPFRPFLIAESPVALSALTGGLPTVAAGAAFARIGEEQLWLVFVAGVFGQIKLDWLFWLAGRTWGPKTLGFFAPGALAQKFTARLERLPRWALPVAVILSYLPGIPSVLVYIFAGLARMRLSVFLIADAAGAFLTVGLVVWLGYSAGQGAVDVVLAVDRYAMWITAGILVVGGYLAGSAASKRRKSRQVS